MPVPGLPACSCPAPCRGRECYGDVVRLIAASFVLVGAAALGSFAAPAAVSTKKAPPPAAAAAKKGSKTKTAAAVRSGKRTVGRRTTVRSRVSDHYSYVGQQRPAPERIQDIERALVDKGFLSAEPDVNWDQASSDAMRRFQQSQNLPADGRLSSLSLIALGLGARQNGVVPAPPAAAMPAAEPAAPPPPLPPAVSPALEEPVRVRRIEPPPPTHVAEPVAVALPPPPPLSPPPAAAPPVIRKPIPAAPPAPPAKNPPLVVPDTSIPPAADF